MSPLERFSRLDRDSSTFHDQVSNILYGEEYKQWMPTVQGNDLVALVDHLDKALDSLNPASTAFRKCLRELRHVCGTKTIFPPSHTLSSESLTVDRHPVASGGSGDVYEGWLLDGSKVCVKRVRIYSKDGPEKVTKTLYQEAVVWKHLEHHNIVPLLGITPTPLQLISKWMPGGDLPEYIKKNPDADRLDLLSDIAEGLHFLHSRNVIHGDLKGPNILVDDADHARLTDFGLATVTQNLDSIRSASEDRGHTARWTAPEILKEEGTYSKEADVFSFAMVMIEVFTGAIPFNHSLPAAAMLAIMEGKRPPRPAHPSFTNQLWALMQRCWDQNAHSRPEISEVFKVLRGWDPPPIKLTIYKPISASTITLGQQHLLAGYNSVVSYPPSPHGTVSLTPRQLPQLIPQKSNYSFVAILPPESKEEDLGLDESDDARSDVISQATIQDPPLDTDYHRSSKSRQSTTASETPPTLIDPYHHLPDNIQTGQAHNPDSSHTQRAGKSSIEFPSIENASTRDVHDTGSRVDLDRDSDGNERWYWVQPNKGPYRGVEQTRLHRGDQSRNRSSMQLPNNLSKNDLAQRNKSKASLYDAGKGGSRPELLDPSRGGLFGTNGHATRDASRQYRTPRGLGLILNPLRVLNNELLTGTKSPHRSRPNLHETQNQGLSSPQTPTHRGVQEPLSGQGKLAGKDNQHVKGHHPSSVTDKSSKKHGVLRWIKHKIGAGKSRKATQ